MKVMKSEGKALEIDNTFSKNVKKQLLDELENLTRLMDIPLARQKDHNWLLQNASINNQGHKNLEKVIRICKFLISKENNDG